VKKPKDLLRISNVQIGFWALLAISGLVQTWYLRHRIFSDGIAYLDIAAYYVRGNWHAALNSYWSPLYSWVLAIVMVVFHPNSYWQVASLHAVNYAAYLVSLVGFEIWLGQLIIFQQRISENKGISELAMRIAGYTVFLIAGLLLIGVGYCSPDMIAMAIGFFLAYLLLKMERGDARKGVYIWFGFLLALAYLSRAAFLPVSVLYVLTAIVLLRKRRVPLVEPVAWFCGAAIIVAAPFIVALSMSKGHLTFGEAGKLNYSWEVLGAPRSTNWQGEPGNLGTPKHPSHKVLAHPATYTFASPVPGTCPLWYDPSYWYDGISPHFELIPQLRVLALNVRYFIVLFLLSPVPILCMVLAFSMGWRQWVSSMGIPAYWFLLIPCLAYIGLYVLVYLDKRYIAGSLAVIWMCMLASLVVQSEAARRWANIVVQSTAILVCIGFVGMRLTQPAKLAANDLLHGHEDEWNQQWMLAQRFRELGLKAGDRVAYIGMGMSADWARIDGVRIVAEVPVIWDRSPGLFRGIRENTNEIDTFWHATPEKRARVYRAFRDAGAIIAVADQLPKGVDTFGWRAVLPPDTPHMAWSDAQVPRQPGTAYRWLVMPREQLISDGK